MLQVNHNDNQARAFAHYLTAECLYAPRTTIAYGRIVREYVAWCGGTEAAVQCNRAQIQQFLGSSRRPENDVALARSRWNLRLAALRAWYDYLLARGLAVANATADIARKRGPSRSGPRPLSPPERAELLAAVARQSSERNRERDLAIVQLLIHTRLRVADLAALDLSQVDLAARVITVAPRTRSKSAPVWLEEPAALALARCIAARAHMHAPASESAVFLSHAGRRIAVRTIQAMLRKYVRASGIRGGATARTLRCATR